MRYKVVCSYDGSRYAGFQSQKNALAIQDVIEDVLEKTFGEKIRIVMSSRTDAGVHAKGQVFHFDTEKKRDSYHLKASLNSLLPKDIHVISAREVPASFHARYSVKSKTYEYLINLGEYDVFLNGYAYQCTYQLDIPLMEKTAELFLGTHDFSSFNTTPHTEQPDQVRTVSEFRFIRKGKLLKIRVTGDGFLRNMVRIMIGTLVDLGRGKKSVEDVQEMLEHPSKSKRRYNISPSGLYLIRIRY